MYAWPSFCSGGNPTLHYYFSFSVSPPLPGSTSPYYTPLAPHCWGSLFTWVSSLVLASPLLPPCPSSFKGGYQCSSGNKRALFWPSYPSLCALLAHNTAPQPKLDTRETPCKRSFAPPLHQRHLWAHYPSIHFCKLEQIPRNCIHLSLRASEQHHNVSFLGRCNYQVHSEKKTTKAPCTHHTSASSSLLTS